jgi:hypothetical protein
LHAHVEGRAAVRADGIGRVVVEHHRARLSSDYSWRQPGGRRGSPS